MPAINNLNQLAHLRAEIDKVDEKIIEILAEMQGKFKRRGAGSKPEVEKVQQVFEKLPVAGGDILREEFISKVIEIVVRDLSLESAIYSFPNVAQEINKLLQLIKARMEISIAAGEVKKERGLSIFNKERERIVKGQWMLAATEKNLDGFFFHDVIEALLLESRLL
ncbi:MAG: hypothetical protein AUJ72_05955 [Candidatus Omnitrophica bacterium CG1_02_46_14]|nr:MAG: hypothetical protein AUJ72_05955 [Candidatus Omnitrophica bacterium CG1_02_46_14]